MDKTGIQELNNLFVEADDYELQDDNDLEDENEEAHDFKLYMASNDSDSVICKAYNPYILSHDIGDSINRRDQSWYRQLMLFRESFLLRRFKHPAIANFKGINLYNSTIKFFENGVDDCSQYDEEEDENTIRTQFIYTNPTVFLEYIPKGSLNTYISCHGPSSKKKFLTPAQRQICILGLTSAVNYLHINNIIHRKICPATIWFDENYYPKLFDFSTTREMEQESDSQQTAINEESHLYLAPELINQSNSNYDNSIDIFALGRVLYYIITGFVPFQFKKTINGKLVEDEYKKSSPFNLKTHISTGVAIPYLPDSIPSKLKELLRRCWDINPSERPTATELIYNLLNNDDCLLDELVDPEEIKEYNQYKEKILAFEDLKIELDLSNNKPMELTIQKSFEHDEFHHDENAKLAYNTTEEEKSNLEKIIKSNFKVYTNDNILKLLLKMAQDGTIMDKRNPGKEKIYLSDVIEYANKQSLKGSSLAESFLKTIFDDYIVTSQETHELTSDLVKNKKSIKYANIPPWITKIKKGTFKGFDQLERVNIPNSVKVIEEEAFYGCTKLNILNIPSSIEKDKIGKRAFMNCTSLTYIKTPHHLTTIKEATFKNDQALKQVELNESLKVIEKEAFYNCTSLVNQVLPSSLSKIGDKAFEKDKPSKTKGKK